MTEWVVYWLHDARCIRLQEHGYVGISGQFMQRLGQHQRNRRFPANFEWSIIFSGTKAQCVEVEHTLRPEPGIGWNRARGGEPMVNFTDEVRARMSAAARNRVVSDETREKLRVTSTGRTNKGRLGQKKSDEERARIAASHIGLTHTAEARAKMSAAKIGNRNRLGGKKYIALKAHQPRT